jgi:HD-GYP domain-containing protein (c-di-GMP phosphodiesterase class II)
VDVGVLLRGLSRLKSEYLQAHQTGVAHYASRLAAAAAPGLVPVVLAAGMHHDVGKAFVDDAVLFKPCGLTSEEWAKMREHPVVGAQLLARSRGNGAPLPPEEWGLVVLAVRHHHERWDGMSYPDGLKGEEISLAARIIAVADAYDAMTTDRPYRRALSREEALREIRKGAGSQFDPRLAELFVRLMEGGAA